ncbi:lysophospholipid acyltransferase family protein [Maribacter sp. 1_MG-2023]|uniref:lysophospholipid acyltransferase family protein n=1 Tax=Maribacter sp. 1_MG-2023 TaxID=3062677 RepID=UPI0026E38F45|nr:lysophospholipid acyltransferase family protein [Maribacter sp. 1_MG-2023]MDO6470514.1 lysophospholipid acyltransferase family protein [Maribacter sp. 1_MG-2023]
MSAVIYSLVKSSVKTGLYGYHKKIVISGLDHIPKDKPVMFLPNHQSALIDVLLIATDCNRKPYFLTRSDVFKGKLLKRIFSYFQMLPIYRMRDGRDALSNNDAIFNSCAEILNMGEALLLFPEANHSLKRRVRPLSKGFTRILFRTFEMYPELDVQLIPVGFNYKHAAHFPDEVAICYGKPISARSLFDENDLNTSVITIKNEVATSLEHLTTHISSNVDYDAILNRLKSEKLDFLNPTAVNEKINMLTQQGVDSIIDPASEKQGFNMFKWIFTLLNFPIVLIWKLWLKSKVPEDEFMGTFRFAFAMISYPIYILLLFTVIAFVFTPYIAVMSIGIFTLLNVGLVKNGLR